MRGRLVVVTEGDGWRHYLDGVPVPDGVTLDLLLPADRWMTGCYERGHAHGEARFTFAVGGDWEQGEPPVEAVAVLPATAVLRWLERRPERG